MKDIDHEFTEEPVCPYCGETVELCSLSGDDDGWIECDRCGNLYRYTVEMEPQCTTWQADGSRTHAYGIQSPCAICGSTVHVEYICGLCHRTVCEACERAHAVCCDDFGRCLEQAGLPAADGRAS